MGNRYLVKRENFTPGAVTDDFLTIVSAASRRLRILAIYANGGGTTSAAQGITASRSTGGSTPTGAITPSKADHNDQPAAVFTAPTSWTGQPTADANGVTLSFNAMGGKDQWTATEKTKGMLEARNGEEISFRRNAGVTPQAMTISVLVEED